MWLIIVGIVFTLSGIILWAMVLGNWVEVLCQQLMGSLTGDDYAIAKKRKKIYNYIALFLAGFGTLLIIIDLLIL